MRTGLLVLSLALGASMNGAPAAVCDTAENCSIPTAAASCRAFGALFTPPHRPVAPAEAHVMTPPGNTSDNLHLARHDISPAFPSVNVHVGGVEAHCQALTGDGGARLACGRVVIQDLYIDLNPVVRATVRAWNVMSAGCSSLGSGAEAYNESHIERLVVSLENNSYPFNVAAHDPNSSMMLGPGYRLTINEQDPAIGACPSSTGSLLHLQTPDGDLMLGWVSTSVCP